MGRVVRWTTARAFLPAASALVAGVLLFAAVSFGGNGVQPSDVTHAAARSLAVRASLWTVWLALSAPVCARLVALSWVRTLPLRMVHALGWTIGLALVAQLPWVLLFGAGDGPARGLAAGLAAVALGFALATGSFAGLLLGAAVVLAPLPAWAALVGAGALAVLEARRAWISGPREARAPWRVLRRAPPLLALASATFLELVRGERLRVLRVVAVAVGLALLLPLHAPEDARQRLFRVLAWVSLPAAVAASWIAVPLLAAAGRLEVLVVVLGRPRASLFRAPALVVAALFFSFGAATGVALGALGALVAGAWAAAIAVVVLGFVPGAEPAKAAVRATMLGVGALGALLLVGRTAVVFAFALAAFTAIRGRA
ncbi:MAG TPA: hypothetical protein VGI39_33495 [Polyangiaceae bacterium]